MPEGDTLYRVAEVMRRSLGHDRIVAARGRPGGVRLERVVGSRVSAVRTHGKHLLVDFDDGSTLHTHLRMTGSWHRYRPHERWRAPADDAVAVLETRSTVAVCFGAPTVELIETRALALHPVLSALGPDLLHRDADLGEAARRLSRAPASIAEALLDQRSVSGIGNIYRSEVLFIEGQDPFVPAASLAAETLLRLLHTSRDLLRANAGGGVRVTMPDPSGARPHASSSGSRSRGRWVYGRSGRPCRRCGASVRSRSLGELPRRLYWCPRCQAGDRVTSEPAQMP